MKLHRIYFDCNKGDAQGRFDLGIPGSLRDIEPIADQLREEMHVIIYMDDIEVEAALEYGETSRRWMARPVGQFHDMDSSIST
jgi:hypothetical protein